MIMALILLFVAIVLLVKIMDILSVPHGHAGRPENPAETEAIEREKEETRKAENA